ncbi:hypothetical protein LTR66_005011 [Elasticomyces elasticus]|nr:hypothetical protein LTR66_005011 [Elasticomyces elasticus]
MLGAVSGLYNMDSKYQAQLEAFRKSDAERDKLVQELLEQYAKLQADYSDKCNDYENERASRKMWQDKERASSQALAAARQDASPFVVALIDGDGAIFQDALLAAGASGGADASHKLLTDIRSHVAARHPDTNTAGWSILVQIYCNIEGLTKKLLSVGMLKSMGDLAAFARSFTLNQPLFNFTDVGSGKENADYKIREMFRVFSADRHCKHIFFGPCHDNGYLHDLNSARHDSTIASRLTLLETLPAQPGFLSLGFPTVRFPDVFRSENLPDKHVNTYVPPTYTPMPPTGNPVISESPKLVYRTPSLPPLLNGAPHVTSSSLQPTIAPFMPDMKSPSPAPSSNSADGNGTSWAAIGKNGNTTKTINVAPKKAVPKKSLLLNTYEERIDEPLPRVDPAAMNRLYDRIKRQKVCNNYHLLGSCEAGKYCDYQHGEKLSPGELLALKQKARGRSCPNRTGCRDFDCINGHMCHYGVNCYDDKCWFKDTHHMDTSPAVRLYQDGSREFLRDFVGATFPA